MREQQGLVEHYLFEGDSCYPLSPISQDMQYSDDQNGSGSNEDAGKTAFSANDQISKILEKLRPLSCSDTKFIDNKGKLEYLEYFMSFIDQNSKMESLKQ